MKRSTRLFLMLTVLSAFAFGLYAGNDSAEKIKCPGKVKVHATAVKKVDFKEYKRFSAEFSPMTLTVKSAVDAKVTGLKVAEGDLVSAGFAIVVLNDALKSEVKKADEQVLVWKKKLKARRNWKVRSKKAEASAEKKLKEAVQLKNELLAKADKVYTLKSEIPGKVTELKVSEGSDITKGSVAAKVVNEKLYVSNVKVSADSINLFKKGMKIELCKKNISAEVVKVNSDSVCLALNNDSKAVKAPFKAKFKVFKTMHPSVLTVSAKHVKKDNQGKFVYIVNKKRAAKVYVELGPVTDCVYMVNSGLTEGNYVITDGFECLKDKKKIKLLNKADKKAIVAPKAAPAKKVKKVKKLKKVKKTKKVTAKKSTLNIGAGVGYSTVIDGVFKDIYGSGSASGLFNLSYTFNNNYDVFFNFLFFSKEGTYEEVNLESKITVVPFYLGARYIFNGDKIRPYIGGAGVMYRVKEDNAYIDSPSYKNAYGFSVCGGIMWQVSKNIDIFADLRYDMGKLSIDNSDDKADLGGGKLHVGFVYKFEL